MVHASHVIISAYGFWLPNDPRGSWSDFVRSWDLFRYGPATKVSTRMSVAAKRHDRQLREETKKALKYPPVIFNRMQARTIGEGFGAFAKKSGLSIWACAIMPDHLHLVIARHRYKVETAVNLLKGAATRELIAKGVHPLSEWKTENDVPKCFGKGEWKVFLDSDADILRAIAYVERNPLKEGLKPQRWSFVTKFPGVGL